MTVIALAMETGTYDKKFGSRLADNLGLELFDMSRLERDVAERGTFSHGGVHQFISDRILDTGCRNLSHRQLSANIREEALAISARSNVLILGWSAAAMLRNLRHVVRVRIFAPRPWRERNLMRECAYRDVRTAQIELDSSDAHIVESVKRMTNSDWRDVSLYHLLLNAEAIPGEACAKLIRVLAASSQFRGARSSKQASTPAGLRPGSGASPADGLGRSAVAVVDGHELPLTSGDSHEEAIAKIERHLHGEWTPYSACDPCRYRRGDGN